MDWDLMVNIGPGPEPARPGPARFAAHRPGKARPHGRPGKAHALAARIGASRSPPASNGSALPSHWPAPAAHGPAGQARSPPRRTATLPRARTGSAGAIRLHLRLLLTHSTQGPKIALARHGPAQLTRITHGPNWGNSLGHVPWLVPYQLAPAAHGTARPARHAHLHYAQPRSHSTHRIRRRNTAPPQVAPDASTLHCTQGPKSPRPGTGPHR